MTDYLNLILTCPLDGESRKEFIKDVLNRLKDDIKSGIKENLSKEDSITVSVFRSKELNPEKLYSSMVSRIGNCGVIYNARYWQRVKDIEISKKELELIKKHE